MFLSRWLDWNRPPPKNDAAKPLSLAICGRVMLSDGQDYSCIAHDCTRSTATILADCPISPGDIAICHLDNIGILPGQCVSLVRTGFVFAFTLPSNRRERIAARLEWHAAHASKAAELRRSPRIVPTHRAVEIRLGENLLVGGQIIDISLSGAAIKMKRRDVPFVGSKVRIGARYAVVIRSLGSGMAVEFDQPFDRETFNAGIRP